MPPEKTSPYRLIVEGKDDQWTIVNLLARHGYDWDDNSRTRPYVHDAGGIDEVLASLGPGLKTFSRLGVVVDADLSLADRWRGIRKRLEQLGLRPPADPEPDGLVINVSQPRHARLGVWLMPDNRTPGTLEHFLRTLVPDGDSTWTHADSATAAARSLGAPLRIADHQKGVVHAWLSWRESPGLPFGLALRNRVFGHDSPEALRFVAWFKRVFLGD